MLRIGSLEDHLLLAHTGFNHLRNREVNSVQNGLSAAANLTTPPDVMDACAVSCTSFICDVCTFNYWI